DGDVECGAEERGGQHHRNDGHPAGHRLRSDRHAGLRQPQNQLQREERPEHEQVAVREVDEFDDPVNHRVADGDEGVERPGDEPHQDELPELGHYLTLSTTWTGWNLPPSTLLMVHCCRVMSPSASKLHLPSAPSLKSLVASAVVRMASRSFLPTFLMAASVTLAAS